MGPRLLAVTILGPLVGPLAGCRFDPMETAGDGPAGADAPADAPGAPDGAADGPDAPPGFCDRGDPALLVCLEFEDSVTDGSARALPVTTLGTIQFTDGPPGMGRAVLLDATSRIQIADGPAWDPASAMTWEIWLRPMVIPTGGSRRGVFDKEGEWSSFLFMGGDVTCESGEITLTLDAAATTTAWHRVTCVLDAGVMLAYLDGAPITNVSGPGNGDNTGETVFVGANGPGGDENFIGALDGLRIWAAARTP